MRLTNLQAAKLGFTHCFQLLQEHFTETTNNTPQAITLMTLKAGDVFFGQDCMMEVKVNGATLATYTVSLGVTGALTQFIGNSNVLAAGAEYFAPAESVAPYVATADIALVANGICGAAEALASGTGLEMYIWCKISEKKERSAEIQF